METQIPSEYEYVKVILPAGEIPLDALVTKVTGEKEYLLREEIIIYGKLENHESTGDKSKTVIKAGENCRFLLGVNGDVNAIDCNTKLAWIVSKVDLLEWLENEIEGEGQ